MNQQSHRFSVLEDVPCNLCGSTSVQSIDVQANVVRCCQCGLTFASPRPSSAQLRLGYTDIYYDGWLPEEKDRGNLWQRRLADLLKHKQEGKLLDVGCGNGMFLSIARTYFDTYGTEISEHVARYAWTHYEIRIFVGTLEEAGFPASNFDVVTAWHVLEHLPDPSATLREVRRIIKPDGLLVIEVPNDNWWRLVLRRRRTNSGIYEPLEEAHELHLYHFSKDTLLQLLQGQGFAVYWSGVGDFRVNYTFRARFNRLLHVFVNRLSGINIAAAIRLYARPAQ